MPFMPNPLSPQSGEQRPLLPPQQQPRVGPPLPIVAPGSKASLGGPPKERFGEPLKFLPVAYVCSTIVYLYFVYVTYHCVPKLQIWEKPDLVDQDVRSSAHFDLVVFHILFVLLLFCYARSIFVSPGRIPEDDDQWDYLPKGFPQPQVNAADPLNVGISLQETKKTGDRRHCKWCGKYKPDRCHHCRVCRMCILKMDHHCPWIYNCVGFHNYKYFFLVLIYASLASNYIVWTMGVTVSETLGDRQSSVSPMFVVLFGETLAGFMAMMTTLFLGFHTWLASRAMTTIEFCEKQVGKAAKGPKPDGQAASVYNISMYQNICDTLGDNPLLWFLPISPPKGDGLTFQRTTLGTLNLPQPRTGSNRDLEGSLEASMSRPYEKTTRTKPHSMQRPFWSIGSEEEVPNERGS